MTTTQANEKLRYELCQEIRAMKACGMTVSNKAQRIAMTMTTADCVGMKHHEVIDLCIGLAGVLPNHAI